MLTKLKAWLHFTPQRLQSSREVQGKKKLLASLLIQMRMLLLLQCGFCVSPVWAIVYLPCDLLCEVHVVAVARQKTAHITLNTSTNLI